MLWFCIVGFLFVSILGALSHFFYKWSGENKIIGIIFPANESTWEHLKLAIFPTLLYFLIGTFFIKNPNYLFAFFITLITPMIVIPLIFYTYTAFTKKTILIIDILSYFVAVLIAFILCYVILNQTLLGTVYNIVAVIGIVLIMISYLTFTVCPPKTFLFKDPISGKYGINKKD